jgi:chaperonin GroES
MTLEIDKQSIEGFIMVGDRVLVQPRESSGKTKSGLYLPPGVKEKESTHSGYVIRVGPGYPMPALGESDEPWKQQDDVKYVPLQAKVGDIAIYLNNSGNEIVFKGEKYLILPHSAILMLIRDEGLFD